MEPEAGTIEDDAAVGATHRPADDNEVPGGHESVVFCEFMHPYDNVPFAFMTTVIAVCVPPVNEASAAFASCAATASSALDAFFCSSVAVGSFSTAIVCVALYPTTIIGA